MSKIIEAKFVCEKCMKEFTGQSYLSIHMDVYDGADANIHHKSKAAP